MTGVMGSIWMLKVLLFEIIISLIQFIMDSMKRNDYNFAANCFQRDLPGLKFLLRLASSSSRTVRPVGWHSVLTCLKQLAPASLRLSVSGLLIENGESLSCFSAWYFGDSFIDEFGDNGVDMIWDFSSAFSRFFCCSWWYWCNWYCCCWCCIISLNVNRQLLLISDDVKDGLATDDTFFGLLSDCAPSGNCITGNWWWRAISL